MAGNSVDCIDEAFGGSSRDNGIGHDGDKEDIVFKNISGEPLLPDEKCGDRRDECTVRAIATFTLSYTAVRNSSSWMVLQDFDDVY